MKKLYQLKVVEQKELVYFILPLIFYTNLTFLVIYYTF